MDWGSADLNAVFTQLIEKHTAKLANTRSYLSSRESELDYKRNEILAGQACVIAAQFAAGMIDKSAAERQICSLTEREEMHTALLAELEKVDSKWHETDAGVREACDEVGVSFSKVIAYDGQMNLLAKSEAHKEAAKHGRYGTPSIAATQEAEFAELMQQLSGSAGTNQKTLIDEPIEANQSTAPLTNDATKATSYSSFSGIAASITKGLLADETHRKETCDQIKATAKLLDLLLPSVTPQAVTQADCSTFKERLRTMPKIYGRSGKADDWQNAADIAIAGQGEGLAHGTINRHISHANKILTTAKKVGIEVANVNFLALSVPRSKSQNARKDRQQFEIPELLSIFSQPVFTGCARELKRFKPGETVIHDSQYWVPLVANYTGARKTEICKMSLEDVVVDCEVPFFDIRDNEFGPLKNESSERVIPIHPELIRLGFIDFVRALKFAERKAVFAELIGGADSYGPGDCYYKNGWSKLIKAAGIRDKSKVFHSFRHTFITTTGNKNVSDHFRARVVGHAKKNESETRYEKFQDAGAALHVIEAIPVITSHLMPKPIVLGTRTEVPRRGPRK